MPVETTGPAWRCEGLTVRYPREETNALTDITVDIAPARCTAVLGPNGSGKSTLLKALLGVVAPAAGAVMCFGEAMATWSRGALARAVGVVPQEETEAFPMSARALVAMGRYPHLGPWRAEGPADVAAIDRAMTRCDVAAFADRPLDTLSGGERQRVRIARALAQEPRALALDEPTASLDIAHEMEILALLRSLAHDGVTVVHITHHLTVAARYADRVILLQRGRLVAEGASAEVLTPARLEAVFGWPVAVARTAAGASYLVPDGDAR
jgi:iron complex transport system ATP-binding protein